MEIGWMYEEFALMRKAFGFRTRIIRGAVVLMMAGVLSSALLAQGPPTKSGSAVQSPAQPGAAPQQGAPQQGQEKRPPRAKSQEELNAYQQFMGEQNPDRQIKLIEDFL